MPQWSQFRFDFSCRGVSADMRPHRSRGPNSMLESGKQSHRGGLLGLDTFFDATNRTILAYT